LDLHERLSRPNTHPEKRKSGKRAAAKNSNYPKESGKISSSGGEKIPRSDGQAIWGTKTATRSGRRFDREAGAKAYELAAIKNFQVLTPSTEKASRGGVPTLLEKRRCIYLTKKKKVVRSSLSSGENRKRSTRF